jgi:hypothetical protein
MHIKPIASDAMDVEELTRWNLLARKAALITYEYLRKNVPGCEKCFIMQTAPQLGTQGGRRVIGEYILTPSDMESDEVFDDTIVVLANNDNGEYPNTLPSASRTGALCLARSTGCWSRAAHSPPRQASINGSTSSPTASRTARRRARRRHSQ